MFNLSLHFLVDYHTSGFLQEKVEMEDIYGEPFIDIDGCDKKNSLAVVEYIDDLYNFYRKAEVRSISSIPVWYFGCR